MTTRELISRLSDLVETGKLDERKELNFLVLTGKGPVFATFQDIAISNDCDDLRLQKCGAIVLSIDLQL